MKTSQSFLFNDGHSFEETVSDLIDHCLYHLEKELFVSPEDKFCLIRSLPLLVLMLDGQGESANVFKSRKVKIGAIQKFVKV